ncbi:MAG: SDR family NAD(P)-dependent oxidoreductase [Saprospiraceae bacterium]|nr:SDR family NAD(P)-dependent oxidoreductase [Bacteroidia bacterium]NNE14969.1 SDR family NAD(P)-dependent oxidoreductase [Saprospiraceae bacterium]NNL92193.1 SDR family NAD(P)-dependent oxidoreductase [Saprospiraceae bacterium]
MSKIILITGATSGIGKASAEVFAKKGYDLIITGRRQKKLNDLSYKLAKKYAVKTLPLCFDIRILKEVKKATQKIKGKWKNIDILLNNAGLAKGFHEIHEGVIEDWDIMIDTNLKGLLYMTRMIAPSMVKKKKGHIINIASVAGKEVYPKGNVYCATKFAVDALTKAMRIDLHKYGLKVSQVAPGHVEQTEFSLVRFNGDEDKSKIYQDFKPVNSKDIAKIVYFIASQPKHVNIQDILVMGTQQASSNFINRSGR